MDPMLEKYLKDKFGENYGQKAQDDYSARESNINAGSVASAFGDALARRPVGSQNEYFSGLKKQAKDDTIGKIEREKQSYIADVGFENQQNKVQRENDQFDPNSKASIAFRKSMENVAPGIAKQYGADWANVSAGDSDNVWNPLKFKEAQATRLQAAQLAKQDKLKAASDKKSERDFALSTPYGLANTIEDAKNLKSVDEEKKNFDSKITEMIALREKHKGGDMFNREDVARGQQLSKDLLLAYKNLAKLGVLSVSDEKILNKIIPADPLEYNSIASSVQEQDPIMHTLTKFKADSESDFQNRLNNRLRNPVQLSKDPPPATKVINGKNYKKVQGGWEEI